MLIKVAWRNIWRNKKRSLIIMGAITVGLWAGIFMMAFYNGVIEQRINTAITREISHMQIHHPEFIRDYDIAYTLPEGHRMLDSIQKIPEIKAVSGRIILRGMIASANGSSGITINAISPTEEDQVTGLKTKLTEGKYFQPGKANEILVSEKTLKKLKLKLNKKTILTFQDKNGDLASAAFRVCGQYKTINTPYDEMNVFVELSDVDSLAGIPGQLNEIAILLSSNETLTGIQERLKDKFQTVLIRNWMEISPELNLTVSMADQMLLIFIGIILLALAFGIINTMMMAILERTREIGMLLALGMNKLKIFTMILLETFFLVAAGTPAGILFALATIGITRKTGINLQQFSEAYANFGYDPSIYPSLTLRHFLLMLLLIVITAVISALFPARRAWRLKPALAIKK